MHIVRTKATQTNKQANSVPKQTEAHQNRGEGHAKRKHGLHEHGQAGGVGSVGEVLWLGFAGFTLESSLFLAISLDAVGGATWVHHRRVCHRRRTQLCGIRLGPSASCVLHAQSITSSTRRGCSIFPGSSVVGRPLLHCTGQRLELQEGSIAVLTPGYFCS